MRLKEEVSKLIYYFRHEVYEAVFSRSLDTLYFTDVIMYN